MALDIKEVLRIAEKEGKLQFPDNCEEEVFRLLQGYFKTLDDVEINFLTKGSASVVFEIKKGENKFVLKLGEVRKSFPTRSHKRIIKSLIYEQLGEKCCVEMQEMVKTYSEDSFRQDDVITGKEIAELIDELVKAGIIVCDLRTPIRNVGRNKDGEVVWIDKEHIYTIEQLDEISPTKWDDTCDRAIYGRDKRPIGMCYGPGHLKRRVGELTKAGLLPQNKRNKGPQH